MSGAGPISIAGPRPRRRNAGRDRGRPSHDGQCPRAIQRRIAHGRHPRREACDRGWFGQRRRRQIDHRRQCRGVPSAVGGEGRPPRRRHLWSLRSRDAGRWRFTAGAGYEAHSARGVRPEDDLDWLAGRSRQGHGVARADGGSRDRADADRRPVGRARLPDR